MKIIKYIEYIKDEILNFKKTQKHRFNFYTVGFHGDIYLTEFVLNCLAKCEQFIETGSNVGSTLNYVANNFSSIPLYSCEPDKKAYTFALSKVKHFNNVKILNQLSPAIFYDLLKQDKSYLYKDTVFWLDAHGYGYKWPLKKEIAFITQNFTKAYIFIDDFKVPGLNCFKWDEYDNQESSFDFIKDSINKKINFSLYYPSYTEKTSQHHPLTGWGLIEFGHDNKLEIPHRLQGKINKAI